MKPSNNKEKSILLDTLVNMINDARKRVAVVINQELSLLYWNIGKTIRSEILHNKRANYGKNIVEDLSIELTKLYGKGFSKRNLHNFIKYNELFQDIEIVQTVSAQLTWSHINILLYIDNEIKREFYIQICKHERWSVRTLQERIDSMLFERTAISKKPEKTIIQDLQNLKNNNQLSPDLVFRDPYLLDFLELTDTFSEKDLENNILARLQYFLTELGSDFAFLARQKRIIIDNEDYYIDLLFYHRTLRCLVVIDLLDKNEHIKVAEFTTQLPDKNLLKEKLDKAIELANHYLDDKNKPNN